MIIRLSSRAKNKDQSVTAVARIDLADGTYQVTENGQEMVF